METTNRMDGLSEKVAEALLKLTTSIIKGKIRTKYLLRVHDFLEEISMEKIYFFNFVNENHPEILEEYEKFFDILWGENIRNAGENITQHLANDLHNLQLEHKWRKIRVKVCGITNSPAEFNHSGMMQDHDALLVVENYPYHWMPHGKSISETLTHYNFPKNVRVKYAIRFCNNKKDSSLEVTFFKVNYKA